MKLFDWLDRRRKDAEPRDELEFHLEAETQERIASGLPEDEAKNAARRELGNTTLLHEEIRTLWSWTTVEQLGQDLRYAVRTMAANRAFTAMAALSLALGIGANTAIYSFVESILLRSLPVPDPKSLVIMKWRARGFPPVARSFTLTTGGTHDDPRGGRIGSVFPYPALDLFRANTGVLLSAFGYLGAGDSLNVTAGDQTDAVPGQYVSGDYFRGMGVTPAAGRLISSDDDQTGAPSVAVLSHRFARQHFGESARAVGEAIRINTIAFKVVGVAPPEFFGAEPGAEPDIYLPMHSNLLLEQAVASSSVAKDYLDRNYYWIEIMARLKPGVSVGHAQAVLQPQFQQFVLDSASNDRERADLPELRILEGAGGLDSLRFRYSKPLYLLMAMVGLILLIACANVANLLLARATARRREMAVRLSIGASRLRVMRQLLTESVLLASLGGALGVMFAFWGIRFVTLLFATGREGFSLRAELNWHVLGVTLGLSVLTGLMFGLAPALQATGVDLTPALKDAQASVLSRRLHPVLARIGLSRILVGAQIAFSLLLLVTAGLFGRTLSNLHSIRLGFNRENVLLFTIKPQAVGYDGPALAQLYGVLRERLSQIPGVRGASFSNAPLPAGGGSKAPITAPGGSATPPVRAGLFRAGPAFFATMQIPLAAGREFDQHDGVGSSRVAIVNRRFTKVFGLENPVGRAFMLGNSRYEIVGVVGDALFLNLKDTLEPMVYLPSLSLRPPGQVTFEVRAAGNPLDQARTVRDIVRQTDSRLAVSDMKTEAAHIDQAINQEVALARLCTVFAALALMIACVGLYGTVAHNVARRTREIGIRMALGAQRPSVLWMVISEVFSPCLAGVVVGVGAALAISRYTESLLFGVKPHDALALTAAVAMLLSAAVVAAFAAAQRASGIDPMVALRHE
jgi:macrolide transport system ATP-binding/permease protein